MSTQPAQPFEALVRLHGRTVLRVCRAVAGPDLADDAWSETFMAALRAYARLPGDANHEAWLVTIARRESIELLRARSRAPVPSADLADSPAPQRVDGWQRDLWEDLARLPEKQRAAVVYHHIAGLPHADVGEILGNGAVAARRASADGIAALRRIQGESS